MVEYTKDEIVGKSILRRFRELYDWVNGKVGTIEKDVSDAVKQAEEASVEAVQASADAQEAATKANAASTKVDTFDGRLTALDTEVGTLSTDLGDTEVDVANAQADILKRVTIAQGTENAGKVLGIGADGNVTPVEGGGGGATYTAGDAIEIDAENKVNVKYGTGLQLNATTNTLEVDSSGMKWTTITLEEYLALSDDSIVRITGSADVATATTTTQYYYSGSSGIGYSLTYGRFTSSDVAFNNKSFSILGCKNTFVNGITVKIGYFTTSYSVMNYSIEKLFVSSKGNNYYTIFIGGIGGDMRDPSTSSQSSSLYLNKGNAFIKTATIDKIEVLR